MSINKEDLKKKIIYRATYRGSKEMDYLLTAFIKKNIEVLDYKELIFLSNLIQIDDENLYKFNNNKKTTVKIEMNRVSILFKNFKLQNN